MPVPVLGAGRASAHFPFFFERERRDVMALDQFRDVSSPPRLILLGQELGAVEEGICELDHSAVMRLCKVYRV